MPTLSAVQGCCNSQPTSQARQAADVKQAQPARRSTLHVQQDS